MSHNKFITTSISNMLADVSSATLGAGDGIEAYPLCDYVMQSVFLKMTGALEQKMKCITWEMATHDYEYRYMRYSKSPLGECSSYQEKKDIYKDLTNQIKKYKNKDFTFSLNEKQNILHKTSAQMRTSFSDSNLLLWAQKSVNEYYDIWNDISHSHFAPDGNNLFTKKSNLSNMTDTKKSLDEIYTDHLYKHRNRVAHNTFSYQQNLPTLNTLAKDDYKYDNYFIYFATLLLIDNIFIALFKEYLISLDNT